MLHKKYLVLILSVFFLISILPNIQSATWNSSYTSGLVSYYYFNNKSDILHNVEWNIFGSPVFATTLGCKSGSCLNTSQGNGLVTNQTTNIFNMGNSTNKTFNFWADWATGDYAFAYADWYINHGGGPDRWYIGCGGLGYVGAMSGGMDMVTLVRNNSGTFAFVNGVQFAGTGTCTNTLTLANLGSNAGNGTGATFVFDDMGVWNRSLSNYEISELYNAGTGIFYDNSTSGGGGDTSPVITMNSPINYKNQTSNTITFNCSAQDDFKIQNISLIIGGTYNKTITNGVTNFSELYHSINTNNGFYNWTCLTYDNSSNLDIESRYINVSFFFENSQSFNVEAGESSAETFVINISYNANHYTTLTANLTYNNTQYAGTVTGSNGEVFFTRSITTPDVSVERNITFYWTFKLVNSSGTFYSNSTVYNQTVNPLSIDSCGVNTVQLFNITMYDEDFQTQLSGGPENTSIKVTVTLSDISSGTTISNFSNNFTHINPVRLCLPNELSTNASYYLDGVIEYSSLGRFQEFYHFQKYRLNTSSTNASIRLYNLNSSRGQIFKIAYKDSNFVAVDGAIVQIQRKYIEEGVFKTTEIPKTGAEGYTIGHLVANDVIYNIIIMKNGEVLGTFTEIVANCQNPLLQECNINLNSFSTSILPSSFAQVDDLTFTLDFDKSTRTISSVIVIPSGIPSTMLLNVTLFDNIGATEVCSSGFTAAGGSVSCIVPSSFGNSTVVASLFKDGKLVGQSIIRLSRTPSDIFGSNLIFIALIAFFSIIGIALVDNPMIYGIVFALGSIILVALNIIYTPSIIGVGATILWLIISVILILIKGGNRQ